MTPKYLSVLDVLAMNDEILRRSGVENSVARDMGALESALMRAQMAAYYEHADLVTQAAMLIVGVALAHPFLDGNKRTALAVGTTFLLLNGYEITSEPTEFGQQIVTLVTHTTQLEEATDQLIEWLRARLRPYHE